MARSPLAIALLLAIGASAGACRKHPPPQPAFAEPPPPPPESPAYREPSAEEIRRAREAGFPVDFESCEKTPGTRTSFWSCGFKKETGIAHDPALSPCAPLVGHRPDEQFGISQCGLIFWDKTVKLPADWNDCKARFVDEPGIVQVEGQDLCVVFVSVADRDLFKQCLRAGFSEYREGYCRYPLAGPGWSPRARPLYDQPAGR